MLWVESGEKSAPVVALQILLNRDPAIYPKLTTDGSFGPKTSTAVDTYREKVMRQSGRKGVADPEMWEFLLSRSQLQVIEAVDIMDPAVIEQALPKFAPGTNPLLFGGMSNGVTQVVTEIRARARGERSLLMLRFHGHGAPGLIAVSAGSRRQTGIDGIAEHAVIALQVLPALAHVLRQIGPLMHNFGFIELHSCRIAQGANGMQFVRQLADIVGAPVRAGLSKQKMTTVYTLTGQTFSGFPGNVTLRAWGLSRHETVRPGAPPIPKDAGSPFKDVSPFKGSFPPFKGPFK